MAIASITQCGSPSSTERSMNAPGSPSSALHTTYFCGALLGAQSDHLRPVGKPPPPRPRRPDSETVAMTSSGVISVRHFAKRLITVACYVFVYILGVDDAAVAERDPYLLTVEVGLVERLDNAVVSDSLLIKKTGDNVSVDKVLLHDLGNVIDIDHRIEASLGINYHDRSESAETETSGGNDLYIVFDPVCPDLAVKSLNDLLAVGRCTSGTAADENVLLIIRLDRRKLFVSAAERDGSKSFVADGVKFCYCFHQCFFLLFSGISRFQSQRKAG